MDLRRPVKIAVIMALVTYFISKIINAWIKLEDRKIGTLISTVHSDTVQGRHPFVIAKFIVIVASISILQT